MNYALNKTTTKYGWVLCFFLAVGLSSLLAGCGTSGPKATAKLEDVIAKDTGKQQETKEFNDKLFSSIASAPQGQDYVIGQGDLLQIKVFESESLNTEVRVGARGIVTLPLLGPVQVKGLTVRNTEQKIEDAYRKDYLEHAHVSIFVKEQLGSKITLLGAVMKPGAYDNYSSQRVLDVLALAGGLSEKAGRLVQVRRKGDDANHPTTFLIDLDEVIKTGQAEANIQILGGDVVYVPEGGVFYVDGAVKNPGTFPIKPSMTVQEAIMSAGGFSTVADEKDVKLVRNLENGKRDVIKLNIKEVRSGSVDSIEVRDKDIIFVETDTLEALIYGLNVSFGMGLVGVGYHPPTQ